MVTCGLCGNVFREDRSQSACRACPLGSDCGLVRCPLCGYENPRDPAWLETLRSWLGQGREAGEGEAELRAGAGEHHAVEARRPAGARPCAISADRTSEVP